MSIHCTTGESRRCAGAALVGARIASPRRCEEASAVSVRGAVLVGLVGQSMPDSTRVSPGGSGRHATTSGSGEALSRTHLAGAAPRSRPTYVDVPIAVTGRIVDA